MNIPYRLIIHFLQEIGRAGRDGRQSYCHLFLDNDTYFKLRSLMHRSCDGFLLLLVIRGLYDSGSDLNYCMNSDGVDEYNINKFLSEVFSNNNSSCGKAYSMVKEPASRKFDMKEEVSSIH